MEIEVLWNHFLEITQKNLSEITFETWFKEARLIEIDENTIKILVPDVLHKKHLKENYNEMVEETFNEITGSNFKIEYLLEEEVITNVKIDTDDIGVPVSAQNNFNSNLIPDYNFSTFIVGKSNKFARATALAIAEQPGKMYNPLFIYARSGLGKTHLMHAIGNYIVENSNKKVLYVTCEQFVNDFIDLYKKNKEENNFENVDNFKNKYRSVDVLMIDDIQYLEIAAKTQQEFFNTFNELHANNKQMVITSDRSPDDLKKLEERLRTRFNWGITVDIMPPDFELRLAIVDKKIKDKFPNSDFTNEAKEYIASICTEHIRKIEGAINRVVAFTTIMGQNKIDLDVVTEALKDFFTKSIIAKTKMEQVEQLVAANYNVSVEDMKSKKRNAKIAVPRQIAMYICRVVLGETLPKIGLEFGGKDHTTVMHSVDKIKKEVKLSPQLEMEINKIVARINS
ncbi:MAG: chromosomal replication initiator protein DnaA [Bacilli bacterium]|nr:chromosomal replication initiator protein DnaA [Bacilli bacterium]